MAGVKVEVSRLSVLALIVIAGIVLIILGFQYNDNIVLFTFGIILGLGLILLAASLWYWYQKQRIRYSSRF